MLSQLSISSKKNSVFGVQIDACINKSILTMPTADLDLSICHFQTLDFLCNITPQYNRPQSAYNIIFNLKGGGGWR